MADQFSGWLNSKMTGSLLVAPEEPPAPPAPPAEPKVTDYLKVGGEALLRAVPATAASIASAVQGQEGVQAPGQEDIFERGIRAVERSQQEFEGGIRQRFPESEAIQTVSRLGSQLGYSLPAMGAGIAAGVASAPAAALPGGQAVPFVAGGAAAGATAYRTSSAQIMRSYIDTLDEEKRATSGVGLTPEETEAAKKDFTAKATEYGLWEALPEAVGGAVAGRLIFGPLRKIAGEKVASSMLGKLGAAAGVVGEELATEAVTQVGQSRTLGGTKVAGPGPALDWTVPGLLEAARQVAPDTLLLTALLGGGAAVGGKVYRARKEQRFATDLGIDRDTLRIRVNELLLAKQANPDIDINSPEARQYLAGAVILTGGKFAQAPQDTIQEPVQEPIQEATAPPTPLPVGVSQVSAPSGVVSPPAEALPPVSALAQKIATQTPETQFTPGELQLLTNEGPAVEAELKTIQEAQDAAQVREVGQDVQEQRLGVGEGVPQEGIDRSVAPVVGEAGPEAGGGDRVRDAQEIEVAQVAEAFKNGEISYKGVTASQLQPGAVRSAVDKLISEAVSIRRTRGGVTEVTLKDGTVHSFSPVGGTVSSPQAPTEAPVVPAVSPAAQAAAPLPPLKRGYKRAVFTLDTPMFKGDTFVEDTSTKGKKTLTVLRRTGQVVPASAAVTEMVARKRAEGAEVAAELPTFSHQVEPIAALRDAIAGYLRTEVPDGAYTLSTAPSGQVEAYEDLAAFLGKQLVFIDIAANAPMRFDGVSRIVPGVLFVNKASTQPHLMVAGHEFLHELKATAPALYLEFKDTVLKAVPDARKTKAAKFLQQARAAEGQAPMSREELEEELVADYFGEQFLTKSFWAKVERQNPEGFARIVQAFIDFIGQVKGFFTGSQLSELNRAQDAAASALKRYLEKNPEADTTPAFSREGDVYGRDKSNVSQRPAPTARARKSFENPDFGDFARSFGARGNALREGGYSDAEVQAALTEELNTPEVGPLLAKLNAAIFQNHTSMSQFLDDYLDWASEAQDDLGFFEDYRSSVELAREAFAKAQARRQGLAPEASASEGSAAPETLNTLREQQQAQEKERQQLNTLFDENGDPMFSRPGAVLAAQSSTAKDNIETLKLIGQAAKSAASLTSTAKYWLKATPFSALVDVYGARLPQLKVIQKQINAMIAARNLELDTAELNRRDAVKTAKKEKSLGVLYDAMVTNSLYQMDPAAPWWDQGWVPEPLRGKGSSEALKASQAAWEKANMPASTGVEKFMDAYNAGQKAFEALGKGDLRSSYQRIIDHYKTLREREYAALRAKIEELTVNDPELRKDSLDRLETTFKNLKGNYTALYRTGDFALSFVDADGLNNFLRFETALARTLHQERIRNEGATAIRLFAMDKLLGDDARLPTPLMEKLTKTVEQQYIDRAVGLLDKTSPTYEQDVQVATAQGKAEAAEVTRDMNEIFFRWLPETAAMKNSLRRKNTRGWHEDHLRAYMNYVQSHANNIAYLNFGRKIEASIEAMSQGIKERTGEEDTTLDGFILRDVRERTKAMRSRQSNSLASAAGKATSVWFMSSPSTALVQMSQLGIFTLPYLASRFGAARAAAALSANIKRALSPQYSEKAMMEDNEVTQAYIDMTSFVTPELQTSSEPEDAWAKGKTLGDPRYTQAQLNAKIRRLTPYQQRLLALREALARNVMNISLSYEASESAKGADPESPANKVAYALMTPMRASELASRKAAILAAFDLQLAKAPQFDFFGAVDAAEDAARETLFDFSRENKGVALQGSIPSLLLRFQTFRIMSAFRLGRLAYLSFKDIKDGKLKTEAQKEFIGVMGMSAMLAGVMGTPFVALFKILDMALGDDDEPVDSKQVFENWLKENFGERGAAGASRGALAALLGLDIHRRIGIQDLYSLTSADAPPGAHGSDFADYMMAQLLGPTYSMVSQFADGWKDMDNGDTVRGAEQMLPKGFRDAVKAYRLGTEGLTNRAGKKLLPDEEITADDLLMIALGFSPDQVTQASASERKLQNMSVRITERRSALVRDVVRAIQSQDGEAETEAVEAVAEFNRKMPAFAVRGSDIRQSLRKRMKGEEKIEARRERAVREQFGY